MRMLKSKQGLSMWKFMVWSVMMFVLGFIVGKF